MRRLGKMTQSTSQAVPHSMQPDGVQQHTATRRGWDLITNSVHVLLPLEDLLLNVCILSACLL